MKSQKLGRGLDALLGEISEAYENESTAQDSVLEVSLKDIRPNPFQPRKVFDEQSLIELSESIKKDGLIQPIVLTEDFDGYVLVAGERRFRASKLARLKTIKAIVVKISETEMRQYALIENIQRDELNAIELANSYHELIKLHNITHEELSTTIHKSRTHITNTIRLLQLSSKTQKALAEKKITAGHAKVMVGLDEKQQQLIVNSIIGQKLSVRDVEAMMKNMKAPLASEQEKPKIQQYDFSAIKSKFDGLGYKVKTTGNKLTIEFDDETQISEFSNIFFQ